MKRIAIYQRGHVTEEEKEAMNSFIMSIPGAQIVQVYWDHDGSERAAFRAMLAAAREDSFDCIVAQSICRFAQSSEECVKVVRSLHDHHTRVWFARERFWSSGFTAWLLWATVATNPNAVASPTSVLFRKNTAPTPAPTL